MNLEEKDDGKASMAPRGPVTRAVGGAAVDPPKAPRENDARTRGATWQKSILDSRVYGLVVVLHFVVAVWIAAKKRDARVLIASQMYNGIFVAGSMVLAITSELDEFRRAPTLWLPLLCGCTDTVTGTVLLVMKAAAPGGPAGWWYTLLSSNMVLGTGAAWMAWIAHTFESSRERSAAAQRATDALDGSGAAERV